MVRSVFVWYEWINPNGMWRLVQREHRFLDRSRFQIRTPQSERSARESRGTLDENLRREEHCEHAEKRDDEHLQQLCRQPGE